MFCFQCQETAKNEGCTVKGVCGKPEETADLQDLLIYVCKGISVYGEKLMEKGTVDREAGNFICKALFTTITNVAWDDDVIIDRIKEALKVREAVKAKLGGDLPDPLPDCATWSSEDKKEMKAKDLSVEDMIGMVMKTGETAVNTMALLDQANTAAYGHPEISEVNIGVGKNPGILISGHDLKDMEELLKQTEGTGVDVYTHGEMLPANYYPAFKKYDHFVGNYGGSWWHQNKEFEFFNGPIVLTTNCLIPIKKDNTYLDRLFTTGVVNYPSAAHIADRSNGGSKDFTPVIEMAKKCQAPEEIESGKIVGGFAHNQVLALADKVVEAVKSGAIKRFIVMAGCDGRQKSRTYFTEVAENLPQDTVILTAGCAKYRYNKLDLGDIGGIPRILDAGQCNDSYSLAVIALKLKEAFGLESINDLPISYDIAWYEQKAVTVLLALLSLGVQGIRLGPTLPAFLSPTVAQVLVDKFNIKPIGNVQEDIEAMQQLEVHAYGSLQPVLKDSRNWLEDALSDAHLPLIELLHRLHISRDQVQLVMLNHRPAAMDAIVSSGDRVALFPPEYPIFADWKDYRSVSYVTHEQIGGRGHTQNSG